VALLDYFTGRRKTSANVAKERLQIILAHERSHRNAPDFLPALQREIVEVIAKYVNIDQNAVNLTLEKDGAYEVLEINVPLPDEALEAKKR
jgi:cell division topological specificity factor